MSPDVATSEYKASKLVRFQQSGQLLKFKTMTPQQKKARELVEKYLLEVKGADRYNYNLDSMNIFIAKQCAIIDVNNSIAELDDLFLKNNTLIDGYLLDAFKSKIDELKEVIEEINKL